MSSGRRSADPTELLVVDPTQPEATKRARRHLTKRQKDVFLQYGFSKALVREVIQAGWDQVDINNYVLYYNGQVDVSLAVRSPGLDISMKQMINEIIRTRLRGSTPANPKGIIARRPPRSTAGNAAPRTKEDDRRRYQAPTESRTKTWVHKAGTATGEKGDGSQESGSGPRSRKEGAWRWS